MNAANDNTRSARELYKQAGVDIHLGQSFASGIQQRSSNQNPLAALNSFAGLLALPAAMQTMKKPVLASCTDGVGTKILLAQQFGLEAIKNLGQDVVAMCVNDLICTGATPLFFLDYIATNQFDSDALNAVIAGIISACDQVDCQLLGGETAQLPGMIESNTFDLAGFCVGLVEQSRILGPHRVKPGARLLGLPSSGFHANGFSLIRKLITTPTPELLTPTRLYANLVRSLQTKIPTAIQAIAHITGGGLDENLPRILPDSCAAVVESKSWPRISFMEEIRTSAVLTDREAMKVFNSGLGLVLVVEQNSRDDVLTFFDEISEPVYEIGQVVESKSDNPAKLIVN